MHVHILLVAVTAAVAGALPPGGHDKHDFCAPGPKDRRSPCPMLNSLANHGWLKRNGMNLSADDLVNGLDAALNLSPASSRPVAELALTTGTNGVTINLDDLNKHGVIEHDGSLSRSDFALGDNHSFNRTIFNSVAAHFKGLDVISVQKAAEARVARINAARKANPAFTFTAAEDLFSQFESALYLRVFGKPSVGNAKRSWVEIMFREERLPYKEGFKRPAAVITNDEIVELAQNVAAAKPCC